MSPAAKKKDDPSAPETQLEPTFGAGIVGTIPEAAEAAKAEAEAAGVSGQAVMRSAPDGYATGAGEQFPVTHPAREEAEQEHILPTADTRITGPHEAPGFPPEAQAKEVSTETE